MFPRYSPRNHDAALLTCRLRYHRHTYSIVITVTHVAGMLKDKIKRRRVRKDSTASDVNGTVKANDDDSTVQPTRRKSSRVSLLRKKPPATVETDPPKMPQQAQEVLSRRIKLAGESTAYRNHRADLLAREREDSWDAPARKRASKNEKHANQILLKIRENERVDPLLFGNLPSERVPPAETLDMGGRFLVSQRRIEKSKIFRIASQMPKGAHLHLHFNSEIPPEKLLPYARRPEMAETMCIRCDRPLCSPMDFTQAEIVFDVKDSGTTKANIFSPDYSPKFKEPESTPWMRWSDFRRQFPKEKAQVGNIYGSCEELVDEAEYWVREKMIITQEKAYHDRQTTNGVWACFNQGTRAFKGLMNYEGVYRWYIGHAIESMIREKVMYAELRPMLLDKDIPSNDGRRRLGHKEQMTIVCEEMQEKRTQLESEGRLQSFPFGIKIIYCTPRSIPLAKMRSELQDCINLKLQFPDLICGFDLVGAEDRPNHVGFYADLLVAFTETCKELGISIPFMFHAGETLLDTGGSHDPDNSNLYDSFLLNAKRIGHGYALLKHPLLVEKYRERRICLELCPISNELLHLCGNARQHIFPELLAAGLECTLNADNPSLFRGPSLNRSALSHEFYQVLAGDPRMNIHGWKQLAEWSLEHSCLSLEQRVEAKKIFDRDWENFCQWVIDTYDEHAKELKDPKDLVLPV
ncbi:Adenosine deaminase CECR1-A [Lecanosticta acicola]|uniref:Adenosine deaminase CECR1-A n=1 Tax=Lecanosticta acicola TaxID=111012 RepID=A0AAI8Z1A0_9PEZI|nr:Adenosine deaminase CECR1-A [Lecanosticta acicola]